MRRVVSMFACPMTAVTAASSARAATMRNEASEPGSRARRDRARARRRPSPARAAGCRTPSVCRSSTRRPGRPVTSTARRAGARVEQFLGRHRVRIGRRPEPPAGDEALADPARQRPPAEAVALRRDRNRDGVGKLAFEVGAELGRQAARSAHALIVAHSAHQIARATFFARSEPSGDWAGRDEGDAHADAVVQAARRMTSSTSCWSAARATSRRPGPANRANFMRSK
jgi:hypothetical protein